MSNAEPYQIEPELRTSAPRPAHITSEAWTALYGFALFILAIACMIAWFASRDLGDMVALRSRGTVGQAVVTEKRESHGKSSSYILSYCMWRSKRIFLYDEDDVPFSVYEQIRVGDIVLLTFFPQQPGTHRLGRVDNEQVRRHFVSWALGMLFGTGPFGLMLAALIWDCRKELRLARCGIPVPACVTICAPPEPDRKKLCYTITYRYITPHGAQTQTCSVSDDVGKQLPVGSTATVLCAPGNSRHACLYRAFQYTKVG